MKALLRRLWKKWIPYGLPPVAIAALIGWQGGESILAQGIALSSIFTGLLTLTGFMFTARTFITFKLNDTVYSDTDYRAWVEKLQSENSDVGPLYQPLKTVDETVGSGCLRCLYALLTILSFSFFPKKWATPPNSLWKAWETWAPVTQSFFEAFPLRFLAYQFALVFTYAMIVTTLVKVVFTVKTVNDNIHVILNRLAEKYERKKSEATPKV